MNKGTIHRDISFVRQAVEGCISGQAPSGARVRYAIVTELLSTLLRNHVFVKMCPVARAPVLLCTATHLTVTPSASPTTTITRYPRPPGDANHTSCRCAPQPMA